MFRSARRQFFQQISLLFAGGYVAPAFLLECRPRSTQPADPDAAAVGATPEAGAPGPVTLEATAFATLSAICDRLLPRDDEPGAVDLGVPAYIDKAIASHDLDATRENLQKNLALIDKDARARFSGVAFQDATPAQQDEVLKSWQTGSENHRRFFTNVLTLTLEGAFGDPKYGGNAGGRGFKMIGFTPDPPFVKNGGEAMPGMHHGTP
jgi:gluconate 2-dehydrogenase gamma chain